MLEGVARVDHEGRALHGLLPTMHAFRDYADAGGLMSYGANPVEMFALAGDQIAQILDGMRPGDIPVRQATRFELVINRASRES